MGNEIRIAVSGDSTTQGCCALSVEERNATPLDRRLNDQTDGSQAGLRGYPFLLNSLLKNNN